MSPTNSTEVAEEMVRASLSRFETALGDLADKVENTSLRIREAEPYLAFAVGTLGGFIAYKVLSKLITW
jgi:hypothetical protein